MTSWECYENKWFYMKCIGKYLSEEILLTRECISWLINSPDYGGCQTTLKLVGGTGTRAHISGVRLLDRTQQL
jgi:hypothetical protein